MIEIIEQLKTYFIEMPIAMTGGTLMGLGALLLAISSFSYDWRAFTNKKAWGGKTLPALK
ncbi:hypothetical protein [Anaerosphaera multitolerans]|uniref:Uncharacterized protein n=1 Tax=Anaerosphaera multitolerans TaxID=2487351 RepID=A0A437S4W4_9FIRM|nr:hypothetical protein [Anaerosphaera multitolerans]RVU54007.1 hypothetical protein EF514_09535 [Anaerosphaera multitolerans]